MILHISKQIEATRVTRARRLVALSMTLAFLSELVSFVSLGGFLTALLAMTLWLGFYTILFRSLRKMLYSFLTLLAVGMLVHGAMGLFALMNNFWLEATLSILNVFVCLLVIVVVYRPIFFPKINWTEYDFRHRKDRRVFVRTNSGELESARLYDLRRGEGALVCFVELSLDQIYAIEDLNGEKLGEAKILSQRKTLLGRPTTHGIRMENV